LVSSCKHYGNIRAKRSQIWMDCAAFSKMQKAVLYITEGSKYRLVMMVDENEAATCVSQVVSLQGDCNARRYSQRSANQNPGSD
jgi:hypothetical protein